MNDEKFFEDDLRRASLLIGLACIFLGCSQLTIGTTLEGMLFLLGSYSLYRGVLEITELKRGFNMPNFYQIVISVFLLLGILALSNAWIQASVWGGFGLNFGENIDSLADALIKVLEYLKTGSNVIAG